MTDLNLKKNSGFHHGRGLDKNFLHKLINFDIFGGNMKKTFDDFYEISTEIEKLLTSDLISVDLKQSSIKFKESINDCVEEIRSSSSRLIKLLSICYENISDSDDIYLSKPKIASFEKAKLWASISLISSSAIKLKQTSIAQREEVIISTKKEWRGRFKYIKEKLFLDSKSQVKTSCDFEIESPLKTDIKKTNNYTKVLLEEKLKLFYLEYKKMDLSILKDFINLFSEQKQIDIFNQINSVLNTIENKCNNPCIDLNNLFDDEIKALLQNKWGEISLDNFLNFNDKFTQKQENYICELFDNLNQLVAESIEKFIEFHNYFLELQERYRDENFKQQREEKNWIDKQFQELDKIKSEIELYI
ncbi:hypothetical protein CK510_30175 [Brunnivagina elsteri CCALA 953]|uniref:Uncharacterized protein n=2 Tax=Brunnivagina TaxID=3344733 RepID=A0A2A2T9K7_9CYAN|nr:hypothetical protein CK510_30175 [Calothrix elsteri CCALA 953]